jgi:hypothetical protein
MWEDSEYEPFEDDLREWEDEQVFQDGILEGQNEEWGHSEDEWPE